MQFDLTTFLVCRAIAENEDPDTPGADRLALAASMMNMGLAQSAVLASVLAAGQAPPAQSAAPVTSRRAAPARSRRQSARSLAARKPAARVRVPNVRDMPDPKQIEDHLHERKLRPVVHRERVPEIKSPRVVRQWPEADEDVDEGTEINVLLLVPEEGSKDEAEPRAAARK